MPTFQNKNISFRTNNSDEKPHKANVYVQIVPMYIYSMYFFFKWEICRSTTQVSTTQQHRWFNLLQQNI